MPALGGPVVVMSILLVVGGAAKLWRPANTVGALRTLRLPAAAVLVRLLATFEVAVGASAIVIGNRLTAVLLAASYLGFTGFVLVAMARGGALSSCGCFGTPDTPPTVMHVVVTLAASAVACAAIAHPVGHVLDRLTGQPLAGLPFVALTACSVWFAYVGLAVLPRTSVFYRHRS
ncbi:MAG: hypothetical protein M3N98_04670 [Actinomycetota bacterium]|nr:hypothetical protein [Actinomycetota bacterium]